MPPAVFQPRKRASIRRCGDGFLECFTSPGGGIPVLHVKGTPREMGRQAGVMVGDRIRRNADRLVGMFTETGLPESVALLFIDRAWERLAPQVPERFLEEMKGVVQGAEEAGVQLTVADLQRITTATNLDLYKREERFLDVIGPEALADLGEDVVKQLSDLVNGSGTSCSMFAVWGSRTIQGKCFSMRNLDWVSQSGIHEDRLITVYHHCASSEFHSFVSMGYAGVLGCLAGMNESGITLSEVGAFSVREELMGIPWTFMARCVLEESETLEEAVPLVQGAAHTLGYNYLVAFGDPVRFGTKGYRPGAAAFETNFSACEVFFENNDQERAATWKQSQDKEIRYGLPLAEAVIRADTAFGAETRALQAADDGPGDPDNTGNPWGRNNEGSSYTDCHLPIHDMILAYERGEAYVFPVRNIRVIEAGPPRRIGPEEALNIAATVAHNTEKLGEDDWDVMSVVYAPTDLDFWVAYETRDEKGAWLNAPDSGYWRFSLRELLNGNQDRTRPPG